MNSKGADETVWMCRLICAFVVRIRHKQVFLIKVAEDPKLLQVNSEILVFAGQTSLFIGFVVPPQVQLYSILDIPFLAHLSQKAHR